MQYDAIGGLKFTHPPPAIGMRGLSGFARPALTALCLKICQQAMALAMASYVSLGSFAAVLGGLLINVLARLGAEETDKAGKTVEKGPIK